MRIALISMPFSSIRRPSIGLSLIQSALRKNAFHCDIFYLNLVYGSFVNIEDYDFIGEAQSPTAALAGEWVFSRYLYQKDNEKEYKKYIEEKFFRWNRNDEKKKIFFERLNRLREKVDTFLDHCINHYDWESYDLIGFTSVFEQNVASLCLAKEIKNRYPEKFIIIGGANCEGSMGLQILREFPFVDAVCSGEGDISFIEFVKQMEVKKDPKKCFVQGINKQIKHRSENEIVPTHSRSVMDLNQLPYPDYHDYFTQFELLKDDFNKRDIELRFLFESSRGCWWGEKNHCKFCGLNGSTLKFRAKSADRALNELLYMLDEYGKYTTKGSAVDNIIDMKYFKTLLPKIKEKKLKLDMFYETKANLTKEQIQLFHEAGFYEVQPGIESMITSVLKLMKKGVSNLQNIRLLKWCKEHNIKPQWNFLYGFPGENQFEYNQLSSIIPLLTHLKPPNSTGPLRLDRFSPYFNNPNEHGIKNVRAMYVYHLVYQEQTPDSLFNLAYHFEFDYADNQDPESYTEILKNEVDKWTKIHMETDLFYVDKGEYLIIVDLRPVRREEKAVVNKFTGMILKYCDDIRSKKSIVEHFKDIAPKKEIIEALNELVERKYLFSENDRYISLVIPLGVYQPSRKVLKKLMELEDQKIPVTI